MRKTPESILAIDPGLQELGYAVFTKKTLATHGVLSLRQIVARRRLAKVRESLEVWMRAYRPRVLVVEHIPARPLDSLAGLPALGRLLRRFADARSLRVAAYSAKTVRRSVVGDGWAGKPKVAETVCARFPELQVYRTQNRKWKEEYWMNMYDAVALALHHQSQKQPPSRGR
jgi:Holliday junction resolvasome RuvABC endonuclease subunit